MVGLPPTRRVGGARRETNERVRFQWEGREIEGWALNISRSGVRAILDEPIDLGARIRLAVGDQPGRPARIVWIREEKDGAIVGVEFLDAERRPSSPAIQVPPDARAVPDLPRAPATGFEGSGSPSDEPSGG